MERRIADINEMIDIMSSIKGFEQLIKNLRNSINI